MLKERGGMLAKGGRLAVRVSIYSRENRKEKREGEGIPREKNWTDDKVGPNA